MVNWEIDSDGQMKEIIVCPSYTDHVLTNCWPIISVDATHLMSVYKGTLFIYSCVAGADEANIYAFGTSCGNEDYATWQTFNKLFTEACPSVCFH